MTEKKYIAIDLGAESGRVMLGGISAASISLREIHRFANTPLHIPADSSHKKSLQWNMPALWREIQTGIAQAAAEGGEIAGIGVDTWGVDFALLDAAGSMLGNPVCYRDPRTQGMVEAVFAKISREKLYAITGIQTLPINTLFQLASLAFAQSAPLANVAHILFLPDLLTYWLTGVMGTEYTIASTSQMLDARTRQFSPEILRILGINPALFPRIDMPAQRDFTRGTILPTINVTLAAAKTPVIAVGSHDTASAVAAVPATGDDWLYLSSGTWSLLGAEVAAPVLTAEAAAYNITNEGGVGGKIRLLKNIPGLWLLQECRRTWQRDGKDWSYAELTRLAEQTAPQSARLDLADPAFASPGDMPEKIATQCRRLGRLSPQTPGEFTRVILESLASTYATVVHELEHVTSRRFRKLHIVGGGSQNNLLNQLAADATHLPVFAGPVEATALGNILAQAITTGQIESLAAGRALIARSFPVQTFTPC